MSTANSGVSTSRAASVVVSLIAVACVVFSVLIHPGCERGGSIFITPACDLALVNISGFWHDPTSVTRHNFRFDQVGSTVTSTNLSGAGFCHHRDGLGTISETREDFVGTLQRCSISGLIKVCSAGCNPEIDRCDPDLNGIFDADLSARINHDRNGHIESLTATVVVPFTGEEIIRIWEPLPCEPKLTINYLPNTTDILWNSRYLPEGQLVAFTGKNSTGVADTLLRPGVDGHVVDIQHDVTGGPRPTTITIELTNKNRIEYSFFGRNLVGVGRVVSFGTEIGRVHPDVFTGLFKLELRAFEAVSDNPISPDCVELGGIGVIVSE